jgi:AraC-like DNA-binding protein
MHQDIAKSERLLREAVTAHVTLSPDAARLFDLAFVKGRVARSKAIVPGWHYSTLTSRLERDGLPLVARIAKLVRKAHCAALFGRYDRVTYVGLILGYSNVQGFCRWTNQQFGMPPGVFRDTVTWPCVRAEFVDRILRPYALDWSVWVYQRREPTAVRQMARAA